MFSRLIEKYYWLLFAAGMALGWIMPQTIGFLSPYILQMILAVLFLTMLKIDVKEIFASLKDVKIVAYFSALKLILIPVFFFYLGSLFLPAQYALAVLVLASMPAGMSIAAYAGIMRGNASLALALTMVTSLVAPFIIPAMVYLLAGLTIQINLFDMFLLLAEIIFAPLAVSIFVRKFALVQIEKSKKYFMNISIFIITVIIAASIAKVSGTPIDPNSLWLLMAFLFIFAGAQHAIGYFSLPKADRKNKITLSLAAAYMNSTLAIVIASSFFSHETLLAVILYMFPTNIVLILFGWFVGRKKSEPRENLRV